MSHSADVGWRRAGQCSSLRTSTAQLPRVSSVDQDLLEYVGGCIYLARFLLGSRQPNGYLKKQTELRYESSNAKRFYPYRADDCGCDHRYSGCYCVAGLSGLYRSLADV